MRDETRRRVDGVQSSGSESLDAGVVRRSGAGRGPEILAVGRRYRAVVDARLPPAHQPPIVELPQLVAVAAEPVARVVVPLVLELHSDPLAGECPESLDQAVVELALPLAF